MLQSFHPRRESLFRTQFPHAELFSRNGKERAFSAVSLIKQYPVAHLFSLTRALKGSSCLKERVLLLSHVYREIKRF